MLREREGGGERERERSHEDRALCSTCAWCYIFDVSLVVLSGSVASVRRRERDCSHEDKALCSMCTQCYI